VLVDDVLNDFSNAPLSAKLRSLLNIAGKVRRGGKYVTTEDINAARAEGADDKAIHDAVLIAAMFCMYNRYVDGLGTFAPTDKSLYQEMGAHLATRGYLAD
jgi:alkylhydroperoxidase/carboxymuconolactone decarboxylase family protein YurZ